MEVKDLIVYETDILKKGLEVLNHNGLGTVFVIDKENVIKGIATDGDIRRALLKDISLNEPISSVMNKNFVSLSYKTDNVQILQTLNTKIKIIPLVNDDMVLVDYASTQRVRRIMVASPLLTGNELAYVTECIKTNWISSQGKFVRQFEDFFCNSHSNMSALAVSNGTVALHLALEALGIGKGDEVLVPDLTFAASVNAILYTGATPVLVDVDPDTWTIDVTEAEKKITSKSKAIMPVHLYGHPCKMDEIEKLAVRFDLRVIEDCAEALGSYYNNKRVGVFGDASTFSFFGNKTITTGEGGMVLFKDERIAQRAAILRDHGMQKDRRYWHQEIGYNYRMTNLQAAVGVAQFERLNEFVDAKKRIADSYNQILGKFPFYVLPAEKSWAVNSYWLYTFLVKKNAPFRRSDVMTFLAGRGVETRPTFYCMHAMPPYQKFGKPESLKVSNEISEQGMSLPSSVNLSDVELTYINTCLEEFSEKYL